MSQVVGWCGRTSVMQKRVPADGVRRRGTSKSRAVAGAPEIRMDQCASERSDTTVPSTGSGERLWGQARRAGQQRRRRAADGEWSTVIELPETVPVLSAELAALEAHLGAAIDAILAGRY
jgi:hypothetical protein